jgi:hypothetical protein
MARKTAGVTWTCVTVRNEESGELIDWKPFTDSKEAEAHRIDIEQQLDPRGIVTVVGVEVLPTGQRPEKTKRP